MKVWITEIQEANALLERIAQRMIAMQARGVAPARDAVDVGKLLEGLEQFLTIAGGTDDDRVKAAAITQDDVTRLGEYGFSLLTDLGRWAKDTQSPELLSELRRIVPVVCQWILRHGGQIETLDTLVDACAYIANHTSDQAELAELACLMSAAAQACSAGIKADLEKSNPGRPWRLLHLNLAISATRSNRLELMEKCFAQLLSALPEEASGFFREGMREMERRDYASEVRAVMQRYFDRYTRPRMN